MSDMTQDLTVRARAAAKDLPPLGAGVVVAIDGPAGTGKSTVARTVAERLSLAYLDTGATYRAATWWCLDQGVDLSDANLVATAVAQMPLRTVPAPDGTSVYMGNRNITAAIRTPELTVQIGSVATNLQVRESLARRHRATVVAETRGEGDTYSHGRGVVTEGRDVATVVAPDADVRLLLTAREEVRMARRHGEQTSDPEASTSSHNVRSQVLERDSIDSTVAQFMSASDGVITIDTSDLSIDDVVDAIIHEVTKASGERQQR